MKMENRSLNGDLNEGSTDGKYRKVHPNRGGVVESATDMNRKHLHPFYGYGYALSEAEPKVSPDGKLVP